MAPHSSAAARALLGTLLIASNIGSLPEAAEGQEPAPSERRVRFRAFVDLRYDDSTSSLNVLRQLMGALPPRRDSIARAMAIGDVIQDYFNVAAGPKAIAQDVALPKTYALLDSAFRALNPQMRNGWIVPAGSILLPPIIEKAKTRPAHEFYNIVPLVYGAKASPAIIRPNQSVVVLDSWELRAGSSRMAAQTGEIRAVLTDNWIARAFTAAADLFARGDAELEYPFEYVFDDVEPPSGAAAPTPVTEGMLSPALLAQLRTALSASTIVHPKVPLVIVDAGWPNDTAYTYSRKRLREILDEVRSVWKLGPPPSRRADRPWAKPSHSHSERIADAIAPLRALDSASVDVIYIPMSREQDAEPLLRELLEVSGLLTRKIWSLKKAAIRGDFALRHCGISLDSLSTFTTCADSVPLTADDSADIRESAGESMLDLPIEVKIPGGGQNLKSSSAIIAAAWTVLDGYLVQGAHGAVISASWVVKPLNGAVVRTGDPMTSVLLVAAGGNNNGRAFNTMDLAGRSSAQMQVLAVVNLTSAGDTICATSIPDSQFLAATNVVGFPGRVSDGACGTSFSTPRVAWLLAAWEARRPGNKPISDWATGIHCHLKALRPANSLAGINLRAADFLATSKVRPQCI